MDIGSISVDVVLLDGLGTPLYSRYVRHHGQPDKVLCAELEALERRTQASPRRSRARARDRGCLLGVRCKRGHRAGGAASFARRRVPSHRRQDTGISSLSPPGGGRPAAQGLSVSSMRASAMGSFLDQQATRLGLDIETDREAAPGRGLLLYCRALLGLCQVAHDPPSEGHPCRGHRSRAVPRAGPQSGANVAV
ncbi:MAG: hypothetical protein ACLUPV_09030 [Bilophila wadsworthia]